MSLSNFFLTTLSLKKRLVTITRVGNTPITGQIYVSPSNFNRYMEAFGNITVPGHEFIITVQEIKKIPGLGTIKKGDKIIDPELGTLTIKDEEPMYLLGAEIIAYRCRTS